MNKQEEEGERESGIKKQKQNTNRNAHDPFVGRNIEFTV